MIKQIILKPILSEKSEVLSDKRNKYTFVVARNANKIQIAKEIERLYDVEVTAVNTMIIPGKIKAKSTRTGMIKSRQSAYKKAIVSVADGQELDLYGEV